MSESTASRSRGQTLKRKRAGTYSERFPEQRDEGGEGAPVGQQQRTAVGYNTQPDK